MAKRAEDEMVLGDLGRLMKPGFHDGNLVGIELLDEKEAIVKLRKSSGERYNLHLAGLERLLCDGFAEGNIISEIYVVSNLTPSLSDLRAMMIPPHASAAAKYHEQFEAMLRKKSDLIEQGELTFVGIDASYGADFRALCRSASIQFQGT